MGDPLGDWGKRFRPDGHHLRQLVSKGSQDPTLAAGRLGEVTTAESSTLEKVQHEVIDSRSYGFREIEGKALADSGVVVDQPEPRVETHHVTRQHSLSLEQRIAVMNLGARSVAARFQTASARPTATTSPPGAS